jgi:hypothetical protein
VAGSDAITDENRTRYYGRNFCGNIEMECIVTSALSSWGGV